MAQPFSPAADRWLRRIALVVLAVAAGVTAFGIWRTETAAAFGVGRMVKQPIPFSHAQHVGKVGLDCATCHAGASRGAGAGMPANQTCLTCHAELFRGTRALQPLHDAAAAGWPVAWKAVTQLSPVARFHHGAHARAGVVCATCHGAVDSMENVKKVHPMSMDWCVDCHRAAQEGRSPIRPVSQWRRDLTDCSVCHY